MSPIRTLARRAGLIYFVFMLLGILGEFVLPRFLVPDDAAATVGKILAGERMYRFELVLAILTQVVFLFLVANLYRLFRDVDRGHALNMLLLVAVGVAVALANLRMEFAPLVLLKGEAWSSAFTRSQLEALVHGSLRFHGAGSNIAIGFWGLWLFPFGMLVIRSGFIPRLLGVLLLVAGVAYVATSASNILFPEYRQIVSRFVFPLYFGEVPIIFWLLIAGAKEPRARTAVAS